MAVITFNFGVLNLDISIFSKDLHPENIPNIDVTFSVSKFSTFIEIKDSQPEKIFDKSVKF